MPPNCKGCVYTSVCVGKDPPPPQTKSVLINHFEFFERLKQQCVQTLQIQAPLFWYHRRPTDGVGCSYLTSFGGNYGSESSFYVSKAVALLEEDEGKKNKVPGKRAVVTFVNSRAILGSAQSRIGAPPRPASCHYGDGCFITLLGGKSLEDWQVVHRSVAKLPWRGTASLITSHRYNTRRKTHRPLLVLGTSRACCLL